MENEPEINIHSMKVENGQLDMRLSMDKKVMLTIAYHLAGCLKEHSAKNYVTMDVHHPEEGWLSLTVQRKAGVSPSQKLSAVETILKEMPASYANCSVENYEQARSKALAVLRGVTSETP